MEMTKCAVGQEDCSRLGMRFHQRSRIHCVTPDVISKFLLPNNPCYHTAGVNADADIPTRQPQLAASNIGAAHIVANVEGSVTCVGCVPAGLLREAGYTHIGIANGFELFQAITANNVIEC